jgi:tetratricopeptide (TPR) repeat protein
MKYNPSPFVLAIMTIFVIVVFIVITNIPASSAGSTAKSSLDVSILNAEAKVATKPPLVKPYITLASLYLQKVRETSDSTYYSKINGLMDTATAINPLDGDIPAIRSSVAMGRHDFQTGKKYALDALKINDHTAVYYGLNGDADIELGQYQDAVGSFQKMIDIRPDFSSWSRIAYIRELNGDIPGALIALNEAISSGSNYQENIAWAYVERGKLEMRSDLDAATKSFTTALLVLPTYTQAMEGLGKVAFAKKDIPEAKRQFGNAYAGLALAQYAVDLGDVAAYEKNDTEASQDYALAQVAFTTSIQGGVNTDLEESLFLSDHNLDLPQAVQMAKRAYIARPSEYGADYLAWALYKNGQQEEAAHLTNKALILGEVDPLILFHQGMIALAYKDKVRAKEYLTKAYVLNPHFSIQYADTLTSTLATL